LNSNHPCFADRVPPVAGREAVALRAGKQGLRLSSQLLGNGKGPKAVPWQSATAGAPKHIPGTCALPEIELLTETSTQIRVSEAPKAPP